MITISGYDAKKVKVRSTGVIEEVAPSLNLKEGLTVDIAF